MSSNVHKSRSKVFSAPTDLRTRSGRTVTLKVKFQDFEQITRSRSFASAVECRAALEKAALDLLSALFPLRKGVRLLGVTLSGLNTEEEREMRAQLALPLP